MLAWMPDDLDERALWERWLTSEAVRSFESGRIDADTFARSVIDEFGLAVEPPAFLAAFETWVDGLFDGVEGLLDDLRGRYRLATMSNTNAVHWPKLTVQMGLGRLIDTHFPSHLTGLLKPDADAFANVVTRLEVPADRILFFDDNTLNVDAARAAGLQAELADGPPAIRHHLA